MSPFISRHSCARRSKVNLEALTISGGIVQKLLVICLEDPPRYEWVDCKQRFSRAPIRKNPED
jgi:hypothetical protein